MFNFNICDSLRNDPVDKSSLSGLRYLMNSQLRSDKALVPAPSQIYVPEIEKLIKDMLSLDLIAWLDPVGSTREQRVARETHRQLLNSLHNAAIAGEANKHSTSRGKGSLGDELGHLRIQLIPLVNTCTFELLQIALASISQVGRLKVVYKVHIPECSGIGEDECHFTFDDIPFIGDPVSALSNMVLLRNESSIEQWNALELLISKEQLRHAEYDLGTAESHQPSAVLSRKRTQSSAFKKVERLQPKVRKELQELIDQSLVSFQFNSPGIFPLSVALPDTATQADFLTLASVYANLARELRSPFTWVIDGSPSHCRQAKRGWQKYQACGVAFNVVAAWLRVLGSLHRDNYSCQYCYRHRATKLRCLEHGSPVNETRAARRGRAVKPHYVNRSVLLSKNSKIRKALNSSLNDSDTQWHLVLHEVRANRIPKSLRRGTAILIAQLRQIRAVFGTKFESEASILFLKMVSAASAAVTMVHQDGIAKLRADEAPYLITLTNFMKLWCDQLNKPLSANFSELKALGYDPYHAVLKRGSSLGLNVAAGFLLQRAWYEAEAQFDKDTTIDRALAISLREGNKLLSLREIGPILGCSYETVRRHIAEEPKRKYQRLQLKKVTFLKSTG